MRSGESRYRGGQAEPMEYPRTPLDQSRGIVFGRVVFQNKHFRGRQVWNTRSFPRSVPIDKGGARESSLDQSFACMEIPFESASRRGIEFCSSNAGADGAGVEQR
jgi:hypothetical protein